MATTKTKYRRKSKNAVLPIKSLAAKVALIENPQIRSDLPEFKAGDTVRVHVRIKEGDKERIQIFNGVVIGIRGRGLNQTFTVRPEKIRLGDPSETPGPDETSALGHVREVAYLGPDTRYLVRLEAGGGVAHRDRCDAGRTVDGASRLVAGRGAAALRAVRHRRRRAWLFQVGRVRRKHRSAVSRAQDL